MKRKYSNPIEKNVELIEMLEDSRMNLQIQIEALDQQIQNIDEVIKFNRKIFGTASKDKSAKASIAKINHENFEIST